MWHRDRNPDQEENFKKLQKIYEVLNDEEMRDVYDNYGEEGLQKNNDNPFKQSKKDKKGQDFVRKIGVELDDLYKGIQKKTRITKRIICPECSGLGAKDKSQVSVCRGCDGSGQKVQVIQQGILIQQVAMVCPQCRGSGSAIRNPCVKCNGDRTIEGQKDIEIVIDPGMGHGQKVVLHQEADQEPGVTPGNIVFVIHQLPHNIFERRGNDLFIKQKITLKEALCGTILYIQHLDGRVLHIKSKPGEVILQGPTKCVIGEGMPKHKKIFQKGRLFIDFEVEFPSSGSLSKEQLDSLTKILPGSTTPRLPPLDKTDLEEVELTDTASIVNDKEELEEKEVHQAYESDDEDHQHGVPSCAQQ